MQALGMIETAGYSTAIFAADAALKAAKVRLTGIERVVGVAGSLSVAVQFEGDVAAVSAAVAAGEAAGGSVGKVISAHVIPRVHEEVAGKILARFGVPGAQAPSPPPPRRPGRGSRKSQLEEEKP